MARRKSSQAQAHKVDGLAVQVCGADKATGVDGECAWPVALVVGDDGEVDENDLRARCLQITERCTPEFHDRGAGRGASSGRSADGGVLCGAGVLERHRSRP